MRTLLIDGDILAYASSSATQQTFKWDEQTTSVNSDWDRAVSAVHNTLDRLLKELDAHSYKIALSDPSKNFRKELSSTYKTNRKDLEKPVNYDRLRSYLVHELWAEFVPWLEGDDLLGIWATRFRHGEETIIVSRDKDMRSVPGWLYEPFSKARYDITEEEADRFHLFQTLRGDPIDGYPGCPGVGPKKAEHILDNPHLVELYDHEFTRGPRKGLTEVRKRVGDKCTQWEAIVSNYEAVDLTEEDALKQARLARILRHGEYDFENEKVKLWQPH